MLNKLSRNEMFVMVVLLEGKMCAREVQKKLKPIVEGSMPAYAGVLKNVKHLISLGLVGRDEGLREKALHLTDDGRYYAKLMNKLTLARDE